MTLLTYRGKAYLQKRAVASKQVVELSYRRNNYIARQVQARQDVQSSNPILLTYRGAKHQK